MANRKIVESTLRPVSLSTPTIQAPNVSEGFRGPDESNAALEIANAFAAFNPALAQITAINTQEAKEKDFLEAKKEAASQTLDQNRADLAELSRKGAIEEGANPWTNIYRSQLLARSLVVNDLSQQATDMLPAVSQSSSSPDDARNAITELHNKYLGQLGDNQYAQEEFESAFASLSNEFLQQSEAMRRKNVVRDTSTAFEANTADILAFASTSDLTDESNRSIVSDIIKESLDQARLHGVTNGNKLFLESFQNSVLNLASNGDLIAAGELMSLLQDVKPNGRDALSKTTDGQAVLLSLQSQLSSMRHSAIVNERQVEKARVTEINNTLEDKATLSLDEKPDMSSLELKTLLEGSVDVSDPVAKRKIDTLVRAHERRLTQESKSNRLNATNEINSAIALGDYELAESLRNAYGEYLDPKQQVAIRKTISQSTELKGKLSKDLQVREAFELNPKWEPDLAQQNVLIDLNREVLDVAKENGLTSAEVLADPNLMKGIVESQRQSYEWYKKDLDESQQAIDVSTDKTIGAFDKYFKAPWLLAAKDMAKFGESITGLFGHAENDLSNWVGSLAEAPEAQANRIMSEQSLAGNVITETETLLIQTASVAGFGGKLVRALVTSGALGFGTGQSLGADKLGLKSDLARRSYAALEQAAGAGIAHLAFKGIAGGFKSLKGLLTKSAPKVDAGMAPRDAIVEAAKEIHGEGVAKVIDDGFKADAIKLAESSSIPDEILLADKPLLSKADDIVHYYETNEIQKVVMHDDMQNLAHYVKAERVGDAAEISKYKPLAEKAVEKMKADNAAIREVKVSNSPKAKKHVDAYNKEILLKLKKNVDVKKESLKSAREFFLGNPDDPNALSAFNKAKKVYEISEDKYTNAASEVGRTLEAVVKINE